jgi:hypothetical protein
VREIGEIGEIGEIEEIRKYLYTLTTSIQMDCKPYYLITLLNILKIR